MTKGTSGKSSFAKPRCAECGIDLAATAAHYQSHQRLYCKKCEPIAKVKEEWRPMGSGVVSRIFVTSERRKTVL